MERLQHEVQIQRPLEAVYALARQVERYPEFLPGYLESRIVESHDDRLLLARAAWVDGRLIRWKSWVDFQDNHTISFVHAEGPLKGMRVLWEFFWKGPQSTRLTITHRFHLSKPPLIGRLREKYVFRPKLNRIASLVIEAFKNACESRQEALV